MASKPILSAEEHERFIREGYCVFKRAVPPKTMAAAVRVLESGALPDRNAPVRAHASIPELAACLTPKVYQAVAELMGAAYPYDRHRRLVDKARPHEPGRRWDPPLSHTDNDYPTLMPDVWAVGFFIFLTKVEPKGGGFMVYPGSALRYRRLLARAPGCLRVRDSVVEEKGPWLEFLAEPGDVLLFHHLLGHSASVNVACPTTRHALLGHFGPDPRLLPGEKPFARMSTLEKANSARYLAEKGWADPPAPAAAPEPFGSDLSLCEVVRHEDQTLCFFVEKARPGELRLARSRDWSAWTVDRAPVLKGPALRSVALAVLGRDHYLFTSTEEGAELRRSADLAGWTKTAALPGCLSPAGHVDIVSPAAMARGYCMLFSARGGAVLSRRGQDWARADSWDGESLVARLPGEARDLRVHPIWGENLLALVVELDGGPRYLLCEDGERFEGELKPLRGPAGMSQLRVYLRARRYWLVAYLAPSKKGRRLFWGKVDWETAPGVVEPLASAEAFRSALETVGLR